MRYLLIILLFLTTLLSEDHKKILFIHSFSRDNYISNTSENYIEERLKTEGVRFDSYHEYLDFDFTNNEDYELVLSNQFHLKYKNFKPDIIIITGDDGFHFSRTYLYKLFEHIPTYFLGVKVFDEMMIEGYSNYSGYADSIDYSELINSAFELYPETNKVILFSNKTYSGVISRKLFKRDLDKIYDGAIETYDFGDRTIQEIYHFLEINENYIPFFLGSFTGRGNEKEILNLLEKSSRSPLFTSIKDYVGNGAIGGYVGSIETQADLIVKLVLDFFQNNRVSEQKFKRVKGGEFIFDSPTLLKFKINHAKLPKSSTIINTPLDTYHFTRGELYIVLGVFLFLIGSITFLLYVRSSLKNKENTITKTKESLEKAKELLFEVLKSISSQIITTDPDLNIIVETDHDIVVDGAKRNLFDLYPEFKEYEAKIEDSLENGIVSICNKIDLSRDDNRSYDLYFIPYEIQAHRGIIIRVDDVTSAIKKEQQLIQAQKMESIGTLAGGIAHDFNNVLASIIGSVEIMKLKLERHGEVDEPSLAKFLNQIDNSATSATEIVKQILNLSRKSESKFKIINMRDSIKRILSLLERSTDPKVSIVKNFTHDGLTTMADSTQIEQVLLNICINGIHSMTIMQKDRRRVGGTLNIEVKKVETSLHLKRKFNIHSNNSYIMISIEDCGVGIEKGIRDKIFDPFFTTKDKESGTGLGLSMVYNIIKQHNGFIDLYSEVGIGTRFDIYLPYYEMEQSLSELNRFAISDTPNRDGNKVLVVDDDQYVRNITKEYLELLGYKVDIAIDGEEGVEKFNENQDYSFIIMDMVMPRMDGKDAFERIKKIKPEAKVLMTSGFKFDERVQSVMDIGAHGFIQKPFTISALYTKISDF